MLFRDPDTLKQSENDCPSIVEGIDHAKVAVGQRKVIFGRSIIFKFE